MGLDAVHLLANGDHPVDIHGIFSQCVFFEQELQRFPLHGVIDRLIHAFAHIRLIAITNGLNQELTQRLIFKAQFAQNIENFAAQRIPLFFQFGEKALEYLKRAKELQPKATSVNSLEVILLSRTGKEAQAYQQTKELVAAGTYDFDLINAAYVLAARAKDWPMAMKALELRSERWPEQKVDGLMKLGHMYASVTEIKDENKALEAYRAALAAAPEVNRPAVRAQIPTIYQPRL